MVDVVQNVKYLFFQQKAWCARLITKAFSVQTYFITQSGDFIQTQDFEEKPADDEKLMTNETVDWSKKWLHLRFTRKEQ